MKAVVLLLAAACISCAVTWSFLRYAVRRGVLDVPNERSSHLHPTARGGGVAIAAAYLLGLLFLYSLDIIGRSSFVAFVGSGVSVAIVGFVDDRWRVPALVRLAVHFAAAGWLLFWLDGTVSQISDYPIWISHAISVLWIVWLVNLYNFMDGIDAIAGIEAITTGFGGALLYALFLPGSSLWAVPALIAASVAGFLVWNYPPARIFMGDVGSGFLGITFAALSFHAAQTDPNLFWAWTILLGVFVVDATVTLIRRVSRGESPVKAHRQHAYQHAAKSIGQHKTVSMAVGLINILWLLPFALLVGAKIIDAWLALSIAYLPLIWLALRFEAGADS